MIGFEKVLFTIYADTDSGAFVDVVTSSDDSVKTQSTGDSQAADGGQAGTQGGASGSANQKCDGTIARVCCRLTLKRRSTSCQASCE